jgi:hypothetical protein
MQKLEDFLFFAEVHNQVERCLLNDPFEQNNLRRNYKQDKYSSNNFANLKNFKTKVVWIQLSNMIFSYDLVNYSGLQGMELME